MSTFTLYSIGDSAFLEQVLIAVSMITGTGDFKQMVSIGLLLGVFFITFQSIFQGGARGVPFQQVLTGWLLYACLFGPTTTITIEDAYTGDVRVVSRAPIGIGFAGGVISNIGYNAAKLFETGYGIIVPSVTHRHFAETLKLLNDVRRRSYDSAIFTALNQANGGGDVDVRHSWENYIRECTLTKIDLSQTSLDSLMNSPIDAALKFNSQLYGTRLYLSSANPQGEDATCTEAFTALNAAMAHLNSQPVIEALSHVLGANLSADKNVLSEVGDALQAMGATTTSATEYLKTAILEPLYAEAAAGRYQDFQDFSSALMVNQAIQQRNTQWTTQQSMFMTVVRPMLTFFEGFVYAITPILAFMIVLGSFGAQLAGKYAQVLLWIQLWMPVLSIINLFIHTSAANEMASYSAAGLNSMYALASSSEILQSWIATGGMLAAATPVISFFIVSGSSYAMTNLAGKVTGSEYVDQKVQSPDLLRQGPVMMSQPAFSHSPFSGAIATGAEGMISTLSLGSSLASGMNSASTLQHQKSEAFQNVLSRGLVEGVSQEKAYARLSDIGRNFTSQHTEQSQFVSQQAKSFMDKFQVDDSHADAVKGAITAQLSGSLTAGAGVEAVMPLVGTKLNNLAKKASGGSGTPNVQGRASASVSLDGKLTGASNSSSTDQSQWNSADVSQFMKGMRLEQSDSQGFTNQLAESFKRQRGERFSRTWGDTLSRNLSKAASEVVSASDTFTQMSQLQNQIGAMTNTDFKTLGAAVANTPEANASLNDYFIRHANQEVRQEAVELEKRYHAYGMNPRVGQAAARLTALTNTSHYVPGEELTGFKAALQAINLAGGWNTSFNSQPAANQYLQKPKADMQRSEIENAIGNGPIIPSDLSSTVASTIETKPSAEIDQLPASSSIVQKEHQSQSSALQARAQARERQMSAPEEAKARNNLLHALPSMSWSASGWGGWDNSTDWLKRRAEQAGGALIAGGAAASGTFTQAMEQLRHLTPTQREQFIAATEQGDQAVQKAAGWAGSLVTGSAKLGRNVIGAAVTGYDQTKKWLAGGSDLSAAAKEMTLEQRGAFYAAALASATEAGADKAQAFMQQYGTQFKNTLQAVAQNRYGLTATQAAVYAESFDTNSGRMAQAVQNLKMEYAERKADGAVQLDIRGKPVLSKANEEFTDKLVNVLQNSTRAGDRAGSYLTAVRGYNIANRHF